MAYHHHHPFITQHKAHTYNKHKKIYINQ